MKRLLLIKYLLMISFAINAQSIIHVKGKKSIDIEGVGSLRGGGGFIGMTNYLNNKYFLQFGVHYEHAGLKFSTDHEILFPVNINYSILSFRTFYLNIRGGAFGGVELIRAKELNDKINNVTFGFLLGPNIEYWPSSKIGLVFGIDQWLKIHTEVGQKIVVNAGLKISLN